MSNMSEYFNTLAKNENDPAKRMLYAKQAFKHNKNKNKNKPSREEISALLNKAFHNDEPSIEVEQSQIEVIEPIVDEPIDKPIVKPRKKKVAKKAAKKV